MMLHAVLAFAVFAAVVTVTPGLDTMLVVRTAAISGRRPAFSAAFGIMLGCLCWAVAGALGITALLAASRAGYEVLRWAGAAYLCFLGVRALTRRRAEPSTMEDRGSPFGTGLGTNLLNPKVGVFYLSVLPQFLPHGVAPLLATTVLAMVHSVEGLVWFAVLVLLVGRGARLLTRPDVKHRLDQFTGLVFIGFGVRLAVEGVHRTSA